MKQGNNDFVAESTPILNIKNQAGPKPPIKTVASPVHWESDSTEVYTDYENEDAAACLIAENGDRYAVTRFPFVVGRGDECDLVLHGKGVSRRHAEIVLQSGHFVVNDLNSLNGIKVNGYKVARVILEENDVLKFGEVSLTFQPGSTEGANFVADEYSAEGIAGIYRQPQADDKTQFTSPAKTVYATILTTVLLLGFGAASYLYLNQQTDLWTLQPVAEKELETSDEPVVKAEIDEPSPSIASTNDAPPPKLTASTSDAPDTASAPPALTSLKSPDAPKPETVETVEKEPSLEISKPVAVEAPKPKPVEPVNLDSEANSAITRSENMYLKGYGADAINELTPFLSSEAVTGQTASRVNERYNSIDLLLVQYNKAETAFRQGDNQTGVNAANDFIKGESTAFNKASAYRKNLFPMMASAYVAMGNQAAQQDKPRQAYEYWQQAVKINNDPNALSAIEAAENRAQSLYRQALRLEYVNPEKAITMWQEIRASLPPGSEYYTKSNAKIAWYEKWGT